MSSAEPADVARLREAFAALRADGRQPVDTARIFEALHGQMPAENRRALVEELLANPDAAEAWRLARELAPDPADGVDDAVPVSGGSHRWQWVAAAAMVVLVAGLGWRLLSPVPAPVYRGGDSPSITSALAADPVLDRAAPVLRWNGVAGARYRVRVLTPELALLEESDESTAQQHTLAPETLQRVPPGGQLLWQVEGRSADGATFLSSTFSVRIR
jgi:hypothetical protein